MAREATCEVIENESFLGAGGYLIKTGPTRNGCRCRESMQHYELEHSREHCERANHLAALRELALLQTCGPR